MYNTDKVYWHRYIPEYERLVFSDLKNPATILEIGVFGGESVKLLADRFPQANIIGIDKVPIDGRWPKKEGIIYKQVDQSDQLQLNSLCEEYQSFDLIIDDGSHYPEHQALTFNALLPYVKEGGWYIIEDVHSSFWDLKASPLVLFLALEHHRVLNRKVDSTFTFRTTSKYFSEEQIRKIDKAVKEIHVYRRAILPLSCFKCGRNDIDYPQLRCLNCNENMYLPYDSMSLMLKF